MATVTIVGSSANDESLLPAYKEKTFLKGSASALKHVHTVLKSTDGFKKVAQLAADIISFISAVFAAFAESFKALSDNLNAFLDLTCIFSLIKRCKEWFLSDDDGKMIWQRTWQSIVSLACYTGYNIMNFISFLVTSVKVMKLGNALASCNLAGNVLYIASSSFDIWTYANALRESSQKTVKASAAKDNWITLSKEITAGKSLSEKWQTQIKKEKAIWDRCIKNCKPGDKAQLHQAQVQKARWEALEQSPDAAKLKTLCNHKIVKWENELEEQRVTKIKNWVYIAASITAIASTILSIVVSFVCPAGILIALAIGAVSASSTDLTSYLLDEFLTPKKIEVKAT